MNRKFSLSDSAMQRLKDYDFPGNVRELRNILFVTATHSTADEISGELVDQIIGQLQRGHQEHEQSRAGAASTAMNRPEETSAPHTAAPTKASLKELEAQHIAELLVTHHGNRREVASALGISERTLYRKLKKFGLG
jgi:DNA-binding NtrC family response regulator